LISENKSNIAALLGHLEYNNRLMPYSLLASFKLNQITSIRGLSSTKSLQQEFKIVILILANFHKKNDSNDL